jgi:hypothetical protein
MARKIHIGVIGAGMVSDFHVEGIFRDGRANVSWLADRDE